MPSTATHSPTGTCQVAAAPWRSISRAVAPASRSGCHEVRVLVEPPVTWTWSWLSGLS
ncbi:MAG TPA: hypothetical protein VGD37_29425 [Kofleriaceae bacterium]